MTTIAMVIGMVPLALATGPGGEINASLAWVLIGGLSSSMLLTLVLVPVVYYQFTRLIEGKKPLAGNQPSASAPLAVARVLLGLVVALAGALASRPASAQAPTKKLSLAEAQQIVLTQNPELLISQLEQAKVKAQLREAQSGFFPQVAVNGNYQHNVKPAVFFLPGNLFDPTGSPEFTAIPASAKNAYNLTLDVSVPIFNPETNRATAVAKLQGEQARLEVEALRLKKRGEVRKAYYSVLLAQAGHELAQAALNRNQASLQEAKGRLRQGYLSETDTLQLYLNAENARAAMDKASNSIGLAEAQLRLLLNWPDEHGLELTDSLTQQPQDWLAEIANLEAQVQANPEVQKLEVGRQLAQGNLRLEQSRRLPRLSGVWQYAALSQAENFKFGNYHWVNTNFVGLQLSIPVFTGFRTQARMAQAELVHQQLGHQLAYTKKGYQLEARTHLYQLREMKKQLEVQAKTIVAGERLYAGVKSRWQQGLAKPSDLQDAELALNQARHNHLQTVYECLLTRENLRRVLGQVD
jgi:outer membrane protein TolC